MKIYSGSRPPTIDATYYFGDPTIEYKSRDELWTEVTFWCDSDVTYKPGNKPYLYSSSRKSRSCDAIGEGTSEYISGKNDCFTLYNKSNEVFEGCKRELVGVLSACLSKDGDFINPQIGTLTLAVEGASCEAIISSTRIGDVNDLTIYSMASGIAKRQSNSGDSW